MEENWLLAEPDPDFPPEVAASYRNVVLRGPEGNEFCLSVGTWPD